MTVQPTLDVGFFGVSLPFGLDVLPRRPGRQRITVDVLTAGHLLHAEQLEVSVVAGRRRRRAEPMAATTVFAASDFTTAELERRRDRPRAVTIVLHHDARDGSIDARVLDTSARELVHYDTRLTAAALTEAAQRVRQVLLHALEGAPDRPGMGTTLAPPPEAMAAWLPALATTGRTLHRALFPEAQVTEQELSRLVAAMPADCIVQVNEDVAGVGYATLPWNLMYDRPFLQTAADNRLCPAFPGHAVDACPHRNDPTVICPTGFWGYRFMVEQPVTTTVDGVLTPPLDAGHTPQAVSAVLEQGLDEWESQLESLHRISAEITGGGAVPDLLHSWRQHAADLDFVYFYTHHVRDELTGEEGLVVGSDRLTPLSFDAAGDLRWPRAPLVVLNACNSGVYTTADPASLVLEFRRVGACGVVGTEATLREAVAGPMGRLMLERIADAEPVGRVLLDLRRRLVDERSSLAGFVYDVFGMSDVTVGTGGGR